MSRYSIAELAATKAERQLHGSVRRGETRTVSTKGARTARAANRAAAPGMRPGSAN